ARRAKIRLHVMSQHRDRAGSGPRQSGDDVDQRRLAGPVWSQQAKILAAPNVETHALERMHIAKLLANIINGNGRFTHDSADHPNVTENRALYAARKNHVRHTRTRTPDSCATFPGTASTFSDPMPWLTLNWRHGA